MTVDEAIKTRGLSGNIRTNLMSESEVSHLIDLARYAPSSMNGQPWHFRVFDADMSMRSFFESPTLTGLAIAVVHNRAKRIEQADLMCILHELAGSSE